MSITFWCPDAPTKTVVPYPDDDPNFTMQRSTLPELNLSNANAALVLDAIGEPFDYCGTWEVHQLPHVQRSITRAVNGTAYLRERPAVDTRVMRQEAQRGNIVTLTRGPRIIDAGMDQGGVRERLTRLGEVVRVAREAGFKVTWG